MCVREVMIDDDASIVGNSLDVSISLQNQRADQSSESGGESGGESSLYGSHDGEANKKPNSRVTAYTCRVAVAAAPDATRFRWEGIVGEQDDGEIVERDVDEQVGDGKHPEQLTRKRRRRNRKLLTSQ